MTMNLGDRSVQIVELDRFPDEFLSGEVEDAAFYQGTCSTIPGFDLACVNVLVNGVSQAIVPYFTTKFSLGTMIAEGWLKRAIGSVGLRIACVGHPATAFGKVHGALDSNSVAALANFLFQKAPIVCFKGFGAELPAKGFVRVDGLPSAVMHFDETKWKEVRASRNFRRKLKAAAALRYEEYEGLPSAYIDALYELYEATHSRAPTTFGKLTKDYFINTSSASVFSLVFLEQRLVGFSQILRKGHSAVASFMGMDYEVNESIGLYFAIVIRIMDISPIFGLRTIDFGETSYSFKKRIGCKMEPTWIYYRHRNALINEVLRRMSWALQPSPEDLN